MHTCVPIRFSELACTEHVPSTAVLGCAGKGVADLMILYPPAQRSEEEEPVSNDEGKSIKEPLPRAP